MQARVYIFGFISRQREIILTKNIRLAVSTAALWDYQNDRDLLLYLLYFSIFIFESSKRKRVAEGPRIFNSVEFLNQLKGFWITKFEPNKWNSALDDFLRSQKGESANTNAKVEVIKKMDVLALGDLVGGKVERFHFIFFSWVFVNSVEIRFCNFLTNLGMRTRQIHGMWRTFTLNRPCLIQNPWSFENISHLWLSSLMIF